MTLRERINAKIAIDPTTGCWVWMGDTIPAANMVKTHCVRGHALTEDNVWINRHGRNCRACAREDTRRKYWKAKLRANPALPLTPGAPR